MPITKFSNLDFDQIKTSIKDYLRANSTFTDFDFDGSNFSVLIEFSYGSTVTWELKPTILLINSDLKPLITDITMIRIATPSAMPVKEKIEITFKKPSFFLGFRYLKAIVRSTFEINLNFFFLVICF